MIQDLHAHTLYSYCGGDSPESIVEAAIAGGIEVFGICDHCYGVALQHFEDTYPDANRRLWDYQRSLNTYLSHMRLVAEHYRNQITVKCGIELATEDRFDLLLPDGVDISNFDYCLIEHIDRESSAVKDLFAFAERCACAKVGIAHTDLFSWLERTGRDPAEFFARMADAGIFWEMNVNYDSVHGYHEHEYVKRFFESEAQQEVIRKAGVAISVGFDGHRVGDYAPERVRTACEKLTELGIKQPFSD